MHGDADTLALTEEYRSTQEDSASEVTASVNRAADIQAKDTALEEIFEGLEDAIGFAVAVSGGPDSMALMAFFARWRSQNKDTRPALVLTVDHGLRQEAARECALVIDVAKAFKLDARSLRWRAAEGAATSQASARDGRYKIISQTMSRHGLSHLLVAHHMDDQAETVVMRVLHGSGIDGLSGMSRISQRDDVTIVRPLLDFRKQELLEWIIGSKIPYVDDPTNADPRFERARIREMMPVFEKAGGSAPSIVRLSKRAERVRDALESVVENTFNTCVSMDIFGVCRVDLDPVIPLHAEIRGRFIKRLILAVRGIPEYRLERIERAEDMLFDCYETGFTLSGCRFERDGVSLLVYREARNLARLPRDMEPGEQVEWDNRYRVSLGATAEATYRLAPLGEAGWQRAKGRFEALPDVHAGARASLPALWLDDALVAIPGIDENVLDLIGVRFEFIADHKSRIASADPEV